MISKKLPIVAFVAVSLIGLADWWAETHMEQIIRAKTGQSLQVMLESANNAINNWLDERISDVQSLGSSEPLTRLVEKQLGLPQDPEALKTGRYNKDISKLLTPLIKEKNYEAYSMVDRNRVVISASREEALGLPSFLAGRGNYIDQALEGRVIVSPILKVGTNMLVDGDGDNDILCLFILSPIKDSQSKVIAVLILAINPAPNLDKLTRKAVFDDTGETYAFDQYGVLVTSSRFEDQLIKISLLKPGQPSAGYIQVRDPGGDMTKGFIPKAAIKDQPYTLMAEGALTGERGENLEGYRDYRGVMVVGSWAWNNKLGIAVATEVDRQEIYQIIDSIRNVSLAVLALTLVTAATLVAILWRSHLKATALSRDLQETLARKQEEEKQRKKAEKALIQSRESLAHAQAVAHVGSFDWNLLDDSILWSDEQYRIFGKKKTEKPLHFKEILTMIPPEDVVRIQKGMEDLVDRGIEYEVEHRVVRPNGDVRWVTAKADVLRDASDKAVRMVGTIRDITSEKAVREELDKYRDNLERQVLERTRRLTEVNEKLEKEIEEKEHAQRRIRLNEARLNSLVKTAVEGIVTIDENRIVRSFNPASENMFGYTAEEVIGQNVNLLMPEPTKSLHDSYIQRYLETGEENVIGQTREVIGLNKSGSQIELEISVSVFKDGESLMFTGILHDISERKKTEQALKRAKQEAEEASQAKSRFLANMSHEIRTPMNSVIGYLDLALEEASLDAQLRKNLTTAARSAGALLRLINDILDVSKMEAGKLELENARFNLFRLIGEVQATFDTAVTQKGLKLGLRIDQELSQCYLGDQTRLRQILVNLISNAVKFTQEGSITLSARPVNPGGSLIQFSVSDTGIGIPADKIESILEPFTQADVTTTRKFGGTGLGTTISRQLVEMMKGEIWLESEEGKGTTFHFTIEMPESECSATCTTSCENYAPAAGQKEKPVSLRSFNVLLAEDLAENAELAKIRLHKAGHRVTHVWNGSQAVKAFGKGGFDLILMDVQMPEMDGLEATTKIRRLESGTNKRIPILALTASVMREEKERCVAAGMDLVVGKPVDFPTLFAKMERAVPEGQGLVQDGNFAAPSKTPAQRFPDLPGIDVEQGLQLWQDPSAYRRSLKVFAKTYGGTADEIGVLLDRGDTDTAYQKAHALKGVSGNLSIEQVYAIATEISSALKKGEEERVRENISGLASAITEAVNAITTMPEQKEVSSSSTAVMDPYAVAELMNTLLKLLELDDPGEAEPVLEKLAEYLTAEQLKPIYEALELFDFQKAKDETRSLADSLEVALGGD